MIPFLKLKHKHLKERFSVGLDIGTSVIKLVKLRFIKDSPELCGFSLESYSSDLGPILKKMVQSQHISKVNLSVSGLASIIRYVSFPRMNEEELKHALKFEAQKYIPFSVDEVNIDGYILREDLPDNKMFVMLAAVKKEFLSQRVRLIEAAGLKADIVDVDSVTLINAFNFNYSNESDNLKNKTIGLLNIGASMSNLNILEDGALPRLSRDIHIAGNNFTQRLADTLGLDFNSAENLKLNPDKERLDKVISAVESVLANLANEIRTSFDYYESQSASNVVKIFISGGGSRLIGLKDMLSNLLGIEVEYWDPLRQLSIAGEVNTEQIKAGSSQLAVAIGLALRQ